MVSRCNHLTHFGMSKNTLAPNSTNAIAWPISVASRQVKAYPAEIAHPPPPPRVTANSAARRQFFSVFCSRHISRGISPPPRSSSLIDSCKKAPSLPTTRMQMSNKTYLWDFLRGWNWKWKAARGRLPGVLYTGGRQEAKKVSTIQEMKIDALLHRQL